MGLIFTGRTDSRIGRSVQQEAGQEEGNEKEEVPKAYGPRNGEIEQRCNKENEQQACNNVDAVLNCAGEHLPEDLSKEKIAGPDRREHDLHRLRGLLLHHRSCNRLTIQNNAHINQKGEGDAGNNRCGEIAVLPGFLLRRPKFPHVNPGTSGHIPNLNGVQSCLGQPTSNHDFADDLLEELCH